MSETPVTTATFDNTFKEVIPERKEIRLYLDNDYQPIDRTIVDNLNSDQCVNYLKVYILISRGRKPYGLDLIGAVEGLAAKFEKVQLSMMHHIQNDDYDPNKDSNDKFLATQLKESIDLEMQLAHTYMAKALFNQTDWLISEDMNYIINHNDKLSKL